MDIYPNKRLISFIDHGIFLFHLSFAVHHGIFTKYRVLLVVAANIVCKKVNGKSSNLIALWKNVRKKVNKDKEKTRTKGEKGNEN